MSAYSNPSIWAIILVTACGTYFLRWSFLGSLGSGALPEWATRMLRYTSVAVLPGLVAPAVLWPPATQGEIDPARLAAAFAALAVGLWLRNLLASVAAGFGAFWAIIYLFS